MPSLSELQHHPHAPCLGNPAASSLTGRQLFANPWGWCLLHHQWQSDLWQSAVEVLRRYHPDGFACRGSEHYPQQRLEVATANISAPSLQQELLALGIDVLPRLTHQPRLLMFDMDSTFIQIEVIDELARRAGVGDQVAAITERAMQGELDFAASLKERVATLRGLSEAVLEQLAGELPLTPGALEVVSKAKEHAAQLAVVSGGFMPFVAHLQQQLGLFHVRANRLQTQNGKLTGQVDGEIVDGNVKARELNALVEKLAISTGEVIAIGDGANDTQMLRAAGVGVAFHAKPALKQVADGCIDHGDLTRLVQWFEWR